MGVAVRRLAVGRPARVSDACPSGRHFGDCGLQLAQFALSLHYGERAVAINHRDARRVVAAVLKPLQSFEQDWAGRLKADVADDATHVVPCVYPATGVVQLRPLER